MSYKIKLTQMFKSNVTFILLNLWDKEQKPYSYFTERSHHH